MNARGIEIMMPDPIIEDVRSARQRIFEAWGEDLDALLDRFQEQERLDRERIVVDTSTPMRQDTKDLKKVRQRLKEGRYVPDDPVS